MAILRDWICPVHGPFESSDEDALCPSGCNVAVRAFLQAPGIGSSRTKNIDNTLNSLASQFGLTDINNRGGRAAKGVNPGFVKRQEEFSRMIKERYGDGPWGAVPQGATFNSKTHQVEQVAGRTGPGAEAVPGTYHAPAANELAPVKPTDLALGVSGRPIKAIRDPQNLDLAAARPEQHTKAA